MTAVWLQNITKTYGETRAIDNLSLEIASGEFLTLLGPSGCGKTTTLRAIAGLVVQDSGSVKIGGVDLSAVPTHKRNIGMVFQSHALFPHMTVADNVAFGLRMRGVAKDQREAEVEKALDLVRLPGYGARFPTQLSGGQQQRVALARALVINPSVLLLDEPFGALDRKLRETMQVELRELTRRIGITAVFVTHDQEEALMLSDRIAVMNAGRIEQLGSPAAIFEAPATRFVADFMGVANLVRARVAAVNGAHVHLEAGSLRLLAPRVDGLAAGGEIDVAIRAERMALDAAGMAGENAARGRILSAVYHGNLTTYEVDAGGERLTAREASAPGTGGTRFRAGDEVTLRWAPEAVRVLLS